MKTLSMKLPEELEIKLAVAARKRQLTKSELVRQALEAYLKSSEHAQEGSFLDLAEDLIGALDGPVGLSHNKAHLEDYGK